MNKGRMYRKIAQLIKEESGFGSILSNVNLISCENGRCFAELTIDESMQDNYGSLHGGCISLITDNFTTYAMLSHPLCGTRGISLEMHTSFFHPSYVGNIVTIESRTLRIGKTIAFIELQLKSKMSGDILAAGTHTKFIEVQQPKKK